MTWIIDDDGQTRHLGNIDPGTDATRYSWPVYGDVPTTPMVPRSRWKDLISQMGPGPDAFWLPPKHDQNGYGMCNASATAAAIEGQRRKQNLSYVKLSGGDLYGRINGGADRGSMLEDGLRESMARGVASAAVCPYLQWQRPATGADADRARFKVLEAFLCPTFDHIMSAVIAGFGMISGIMWYANYKPDQDGWLPRYGQGGGGGHAVYGYKPTFRGDEYGIWHLNSWGQWGYRGEGLCVFPETSYRGPVGGWWAVTSVTDEGVAA